jgi:polyisoprenoid-binding protein YceI
MNAAVSTEARPEVSISTWNIDPVHSTAQFKVKHMMISNVKGEFTSVTGSLELNNNDITKSKVEASIDATTINTRDSQRDAHLKSADFFDVQKFPAISFKSTSISQQTPGELTVTGDLTIHGVTRKSSQFRFAQGDDWPTHRLFRHPSLRFGRSGMPLRHLKRSVLV